MTDVDGVPDHAVPAAPTTADLAARIRELEHELEVRDQQLKVRAAVIRRQRRELVGVRTSYQRLVASRTYRVHRRVRSVMHKGQALASAVRRRLTRFWR